MEFGQTHRSVKAIANEGVARLKQSTVFEFDSAVYIRGMPKKPQRRIVSPNPNGGWDVRKPGARKASAHAPTQRDADRRAGEILRNAGGGERITQGRDGRIRSKDTIAPSRDPSPPRDREH